MHQRIGSWSCAVFLVLAGAGCGEEMPGETDGGADGGGASCTMDAFCDDGVFCNGAERCTEGACAAGTSPCADVESCSEPTQSCGGCTDADADGHADAVCGGDDCDDDDPLRYPGSTEVCDVDDRDEDCDPLTFGVRDADGDTVADAACCNEADDGSQRCGTDCDDTTTAASPRQLEICDSIDNDCDSIIDEGGITCWADGDDDGWAAVGADTTDICGGCPMFHTMRDPAVEADCDDGDGSAWPGAIEACDAIDQDCDGRTDDAIMVTCWADGDDDGYAVAGAAMSTACPDVTRPDVGGCPADRTNRDPASTSDCDDTSPIRHPGAAELCDTVDHDCDGITTDGDMIRCWTDSDGDSWAPTGAASVMVCPEIAPSRFNCPVGRTGRDPATGVDCNDSSASTYPGAPEVCNAPSFSDNNCNGPGDEGNNCWRDADGDGYTRSPEERNCPTAGGSCPAGYLPARSATPDCNDNSATRYPGAPEVCNGLDDDCDGTMDEDVYQAMQFYVDADNDGYGAGSLVSVPWHCGGGEPSGYSDVGGDCCDSDMRARPGTMGAYSSPRTCGGYDFNCDGVVTANGRSIASCTGTTGCDPIGRDCTDSAGQYNDPYCTAPTPADCGTSRPTCDCGLCSAGCMPLATPRTVGSSPVYCG